MKKYIFSILFIVLSVYSEAGSFKNILSIFGRGKKISNKVYLKNNKIKKEKIFLPFRLRGGIKNIQNFEIGYKKNKSFIAVIGQCEIIFLDEKTLKPVKEYSIYPNWLGLNPILIYPYYKCEKFAKEPFFIMKGGGGFGETGLLNSTGNFIWKFQPSSLPPNYMQSIKINDKLLFFIADASGFYCLNNVGKVVWEKKDGEYYDVCITHLKRFVAGLSARKKIIIFNPISGKEEKIIRLSEQVYTFSSVVWKEKDYLVMECPKNRIILMDLKGKIGFQYKVINFNSYHRPQAVSLNSYLVVLLHSSKREYLAQLNIFNRTGKLIYQELLRESTGIYVDKNEGYILVGNGGECLYKYSFVTN